MSTKLPKLGSVRSIQVPNGHIQLAKIVDNRFEEGRWWSLVYWIDIRRDSEWVDTLTIPSGEGDYEAIGPKHGYTPKE